MDTPVETFQGTNHKLDKTMQWKALRIEPPATPARPG